MTKIIAMTTLCGDLFNATGEIRPGGEALNFAAVASEYAHIRIGIIGSIGDDACGMAVLSSIKDKNIDQSGIHVIEGGTTACNRIYLTEDGDRYFKEDSWTGGVYDTFVMSDEDIDKLRETDIVFINYYSPSFSHVFALKKEIGFALAVDFDVVRDFATLEKFAPDIDYFFISGEESILPVFKNWSQKYNGIFNITLAENGSVSYQHGNEYRVNAVPVKTVVDTTGCGDSYHAGFICSYTKDGDIITAMDEGSKVAAGTLAHVGGFM